jgi:hypothetical protein
MSSNKAAVSKFTCQTEASDLLNCIAASDYVEQKCVTRMKRLRKCILKERVVSFDLLPDQSSTPPAPKDQKNLTSDKGQPHIDS